METRVIKLDISQPDMANIREAARLIEKGGLVAFPTETVYGIGCRVKTSVLAKLDKVKGRVPEKRYTLHIGQKSDVEKYVSAIGLRYRKLIENAWPGPLTIVFELNDDDMRKQRDRIEKEVFGNLYKGNSIGIRCPDSAVASHLLSEAKCPVVVPSANISGQKPATNAEEVLAQLSGRIELVLDGGECKYKKNSTVVKVSKGMLEILRDGVYSKEELDRLSEVKILFVCTGNTCRSPMAKGIFSKYLAEKLGCRIDRLGKIGYKVDSAGTVGLAGFSASPEAIAACAARGIDIKSHKSQRLSEELIKDSDIIFVMTRLHYEHVAAVSGEAASRCMLLSEAGDIPDPIGQLQEVYDNCAGLIEAAVRERIGGLLI